MSWTPYFNIGAKKPWPDYVRMVRPQTKEMRRYVPERTCHEVMDKSVDYYATLCSECGFTLAVEQYGPNNYCPKCGAKVMDE